MSATRPAHLAHLLRDRLDAYHAATAHPAEQVPALDERSLQIHTGSEALEALERIAAASGVPSASSSSTKPAATAAPAAPPPPLFGARDTKILGMLGGVIGKWALLEPESPKPKPAPRRREEPKIVEISPADEQQQQEAEERKPDRIVERWSNAERVLRALGFTRSTERSDGEKQLIAIVLPQLLAPLVRTLVEVSISTDAALASVGSSATSHLQLVFARYACFPSLDLDLQCNYRIRVTPRAE